MPFLPDFYRHHVQLAVPNAARSHDKVGKIFNALNRASQDDYFETVIVIHVHMHAGQCNVVMIMLYRGNTAGKITFVVIVNVAERGDAMAPTSLFQPSGFQLVAYQVAHRLRAIRIASRAYKFVKLFRELIIQRYSETFHISSLGKKPITAV
jgi:hypothetical protein